jgi:CRP/FNR family transcriptional regulator, anaerobic regulatory protein
MSVREKLDCGSCPVANRAACAVLTDDERAELASIGTSMTIKRGEIAFSAGGDSPLCATLIEGVLKSVAYDAEGHEVLLSFVHPAGFAGELFASGKDTTLIALTDARLCVFPAKAYEAALSRFPALSLALLKRMSGELDSAKSLITLSRSHSARTRVTWLLMGLARSASDSPCHPATSFDLVLRRADMAAAVGLTIESVSRQLTALEREGLIKRNGRRGITVCDATALEQAASF